MPELILHDKFLKLRYVIDPKENKAKLECLEVIRRNQQCI
jgi:hypothetical protein